MAKKKQYVLWVVHTDTVYPHDIPDRKISWDDDFLELSQHFIDLNKKFGFTKEALQLHREGIINAMKLAQEVGIKIVYEGYVRSGEFLMLAKKAGVDYDSIIKIHSFEPGEGVGAIRAFLNALSKNKVENFEVIFAGHYGDICICERAVELKGRGFKPYLLIGTPVIYGRSVLNEIKKFFGKDRVITIPQLRKL